MTDALRVENMGLDLDSSHVILCGKKSTGKSNALRHVLDNLSTDRKLVYDVNQEHEGTPRYVPSHRSGDDARKEIERVTRRMVLDQNPESRPKVFAVEELSRFTTAHKRPPEAVMEVVDLNRHYSTGDGDGLGFLGITRRPSQLHADVFDLADDVILFRLDGRSDRRRLNDMSDGLGEAVAELDRYHFIHYNGFSWNEHTPVPEYDTTGNL